MVSSRTNVGHCIHGSSHPLTTLCGKGGCHALHRTCKGLCTHNRPVNARLTDAYLAKVISSVPNMNNTGRLPSIALVHLGMVIRLTNTVEAPEAVTDSTGEILGIDLDPDVPNAATEHTSAIEGIRILRRLPTVTVKLHGVRTEFLLPPLGSASGYPPACGKESRRAYKARVLILCAYLLNKRSQLCQTRVWRSPRLKN